jgi:hypothetical protein
MGIAALRDQDVDDLPVLIDRPVEVGPAPGDFHVGLIDEPAIAGRVPRRARGIDELEREGLHPAVDRDVIDLDAALGQQLLDIAVGQPVAQVPAHRRPRSPPAGSGSRPERRRGTPT